MKKVLALLTAFVFVGLVACGPSAAEKKAMDEQMQKAADSAANALLQQASTAATPDAVDKAKQDSIHKADSLAAANSGNKK